MRSGRRATRWSFTLLLCGCAGPAFDAAWGATPDFVEVAASRNINFTMTPGGTFPGLDLTGQIYQKTTGCGAAVGDYDNDGDLDLYLLSYEGSPNRLFRNDVDLGTKTFTDVTTGSGLGDAGLSRVAHFADLDNDGNLDLVLVNDDDGTSGFPPSKIFKNNGNGTFTNVTTGANFNPVGFIRAGLSLADYDNDGLLDLYVTNWVYSGSNLLYRNLGNFTFQDVTVSSGLGLFELNSYSAIFHDFDDNGYPDIYVAVDNRSDEFWWNSGGTFTNATSDVGATHTGNDMGITAADFDDDGDLDLYLTNITDPGGLFGTTQYNVLATLGPDGMGSWEFTDEALSRGVEDTYWGWGTRFTDVDLDGDLDLLAVSGFDDFVELVAGTSSPIYGSPTALFINDSTGNFTRLSMPALDAAYDARSLVVFDYDRDGDEDFLFTTIGEPVRLMENVSANPGHWLGLSLIQAAGSNRHGVGAVIYATSGGVTRRRDMLMGDSFLAGNPQEIILGVGAETQIDQLQVQWTDGTQTNYQNVQVDRYLEVVQGVSDGDLDGVVDSADCQPTQGSVWTLPAASCDLALLGPGTTAISWAPTTDDGGTAPVTYSLIRSTTKDLTGQTTCLVGSQPGVTGTTDSDTPSGIYYYVVRVENACGGNSGLQYGNVPRNPPACP